MPHQGREAQRRLATCSMTLVNGAVTVLKRMTTVTVALLLALPALASAKEMTGRLGLGYNNSDAPLGVRYWFNPKAGVDLGFGFDSTDLGTKNATDYFFEVGVPYVVYGGEHANLFVRLGAQVG